MPLNAKLAFPRFATWVLAVATISLSLSAAQEIPPAASKKTVLILPMAYYTPETRLAGGIGGILALKPAATAALANPRPSSIMFSAIYTQNEQFTLQAKPEIYFGGENWVVTGSAEWSRYPNQFFGLGNDAPEDAGERMSPVQVLAEIQIQKRIFPGGRVYAGIMGVFESYRFLAFEPGGLLASGGFSGSEGGILAGLGLVAKTDSRDNVFFPRRGRFWQVSAVFHGPAFGSAYRFTKIKADLRSFAPLTGAAKPIVLGFQLKLEAAAGDVPFMALPKLGGESLMRGYLTGRYRDRVFAGLQGEARIPLSGRFGAALFAGLGQVAGSLGGLSSAGFKPSVGGGLRYRISGEGNTIRFDVGFGRGSSGFYVTANEAF